MKKLLALTLIALAALLPLSAGAAGLTLSTSSCFAGSDAAAQTYVDLLSAWEEIEAAEGRGNTIEDFSDVISDEWIAAVPQDAAAGKLDVFFYFAGTPESAALTSSVVPIAEIAAAYPDLQLTQNPLLTEADGQIYAIPVRGYWSALYCNKDLFDAQGLALPTDWDKLEAAITAFQQAGITPISASLNEMPNYLVDCAILACGSPAEHDARPASVDQLPASWARGMQLLQRLWQLGAFAPNACQVGEFDATDLFLNGQAAMQLDSNWLASNIAEERWDSTVVLPFPAANAAAEPTALIGQMDMGFYISRAAWNDPAKREAAVSLLAHLTNQNAQAEFSFNFGGALLDSAQQLITNAKAMCPPLADTMNYEARSAWFAQIPAIVQGQVDPVQAVQQAIQNGGF